MLAVRGNPLTGLPENLFQGVAALKTLALDHNKIQELPPKIFAGLR
jgi:Leucine-rich repeat (LRR) protein